MTSFLMFLMLTVLRTEARDLTRYDQNTCFNNTVSVYYCCSNYEEINNKCIECQTGFKSRSGQICERCSDIFFGKGCSQECICNNLQRCDNTKGCVDVETSETHSPEGFSVEEIMTTVHKDEENSSTGISKTELLLLYSVVSSGIFVLLGIIGAVYCFKRRMCKSRSKRVVILEEDFRNEAEHLRQDSFELQERLYEEIDESKLEHVECILHPRTYTHNLENDEGSSSSRRKPHCNVHTENKSYLHDNASCQKAVSCGEKSNKGVVAQSSCSFNLTSAEDSSSSESIEEDRNDRISYLHPYNTLSANRSYSHTYERTDIQSIPQNNRTEVNDHDNTSIN